MLDKELQQRLLELISAEAFWCIGAAPECASFSRAVNPAVRSREHPEGLENLTANMTLKVERGNLHAAFVLAVISLAVTMDITYGVENPDGSFLWLQPEWLKSGLCSFQRCYRFDMSRLGTIWRKRPRICTNSALAGIRHLCLGGHSHQQLRGRSLTHQLSWTRVAQVYPRELCEELASSLAARGGLFSCERGKLRLVLCELPGRAHW